MTVATSVDETLLRRWPLPRVPADGDKTARGRLLVIAGSREMPGAAILAGTAALHAGAGRLVIATASRVAAVVGAAVPEARVIALDETREGGLAGVERLTIPFDAVLVGPGTLDEAATLELSRSVVELAGRRPVVLDAYAMGAAANLPAGAGVLVTPHAGELAHLGFGEREAIEAQPCAAASAAAQRWKATVLLKGATTWIAAADGRRWRHQGGNAGLGTSGSGDVLAGIIGGLAARGASLEQAAAWGVALHARAGELLALNSGTLGYLARELSAEVPALMQRWSRREAGAPVDCQAC